MTDPRNEPVAERAPALDVVRGLALLGVLLINVRGVLNPLEAGRGYIDPQSAGLDTFVYWVLQIVVSAKFFPVFSLLFGVGLALQWRRRDRLPPGFFGRRLAALFIVGAVHGIFLWWGDVLLPHSVVAAIVVVGFLKRSNLTLLVAALFCLLGALYVAVLVSDAGAGRLGPEAELARAQAALDLYRHGDWSVRLGQQVRDYGAALAGWSVVGFQVLALMLLGVVFVRSGWLERMLQGAFWSTKIDLALWGWGALFNALYVASDAARTTGGWADHPAVYTAGFVVGGTLLGLAYAVTVLRLIASRWAAWLRVFAPVGRLSLTHYLAGTVVFLMLAFGAGWYGRLGNSLQILAALGLFALQVLVSLMLSIKRVPGPLEWVWRVVSYGTTRVDRHVGSAGESGRPLAASTHPDGTSSSEETALKFGFGDPPPSRGECPEYRSRLPLGREP